MAHGRPWYKRAGGDFLMAVIHMPDAEHKWAYSAIIDMLNDRDRPIADEAGFISGFTGLSRKKWSIVRTYLLKHGYLMLTDDGCLTNPRFEREHADRQASQERSVEAGRRGGRASAAARAGQGELGLDDQAGKRAESTPDSRGESTPDSPPDPPAKLPAGSHENNHLAEAPPQATRARKRLEARVEKEESSTANPTTARGVAVDADEAKRFDLYGTMNRLAQIGGVSIINPSAIAREVDVVKAWIAAGYDIEATVIPAITQLFGDTKQETIGSLNFYSARIAKLHAAALRKAKAPDIPKPIVMIPDEDARMSPLRSDLLAALGEWAYSTFLNKIRLEPIAEADMGQDPRRPLQLKGPPHLIAGLFDGERRRIISTTARRHGFTDVWK